MTETIRCGACKADWSAGSFTPDCAQCGGGALEVDCPRCGGRCGSRWRRSVTDTLESGLAHWAGRCTQVASRPTPLAWATDVHFNFAAPARIEEFCAGVAAIQPRALLLAGDIAEAPSLEATLVALERQVSCPIYFVLGNHDFYHGSIHAVRETARRLTDRSSRLRWLPAVGVVELTQSTALVGHDGWGDARAGLPRSTAVVLNDFVLIQELAGLSLTERVRRQNALGDEAAAYLRETLTRALERYRNVVVLTHVPPFEQACWHEGQISGEDWLPHFVCRAAGDVVVELARAHADRTVRVLCGHAHGDGVAHVLPNLTVITGGAEYGWPALQEPVHVD